MKKTLWVGTRKGLFRLEHTGAGEGGWEVRDVSFLGDPVTSVLHDPRSGHLYAGLKHGHFGPKLQRSIDGGRTWAAVGTPEWPQKPEGLDDRDGSGRPWPWSLDTIWVLEPGGRDRPGELWCGTIPGGLFRSTDHGESWSLVRGLWDDPGRNRWFGGGSDLPGIHSICVHPGDPADVLVGVSCGGVWRTSDRGATWACTSKGMVAAYMPPDRSEDPFIQDPHRVVRAPSSPNRMFAQHHNGIFASEDGGRSWFELKDVPPSTFGFAVAVHPRDPATAWFVPAVKDELRVPVDGKVVVTRTRDGGNSFDVLREGLPQRHAYDLVYRHALDVTEGEGGRAALAFGSTTGNLWFSEDEGDRWAHVSAHLPPIYCVRFE